MSLENKIAFVTGSSRGIGRAIALQLAQDGFDVIVHYNQQKERAEGVVQEIRGFGRKSHLVQADLSKEEDISQISEKLSQITDKLDLLVNNAGINICKNIEDYSTSDINTVIQLVLTQKVRLTQICLPLLRKGTSSLIINTASRLGLMVETETSIYCAAQAGLIHFTKAMALELSPDIRVNCVAPGTTKTEMLTLDWGPEEIAKVNPLKRLAEPEDIANAVSFLASDKTTYITGECLEVSGGRTLI
jgi:3-oxoacyl-[acyl-carrier protein] reductase